MPDPYCTSADVAAEFKNIDFTKTDAAVSDAKVTEWCVQAAAEINNRLSVRYQIPLIEDYNISEDGMSLIKMLAIKLVAQRVTGVLESKNVRPETDTQVKVNTANEARKIIQDIVDKKLPLLGAIPATPEDGTTSGINAGSLTKGFTFTREGNDW